LPLLDGLWLALQKDDAIGFDYCIEGERRARFALTPAAVTAVNEHRPACHTIAHGGAGAATFQCPVAFLSH
jgi:hypothetical protein